MSSNIMQSWTFITVSVQENHNIKNIFNAGQSASQPAQQASSHPLTFFMWVKNESVQDHRRRRANAQMTGIQNGKCNLLFPLNNFSYREELEGWQQCRIIGGVTVVTLSYHGRGTNNTGISWWLCLHWHTMGGWLWQHWHIMGGVTMTTLSNHGRED